MSIRVPSTPPGTTAGPEPPAGPLTITGIGAVDGWHSPTVWFLANPGGVVRLPGNPAHDALLESWRRAFRTSDAPRATRVRLDAAGNPVVEAGT